MKSCFLFQRTADPGWPVGKRAVFWLWNLLLVTAGGLGVGVLSLFFAMVDRRGELLLSYFQTPAIAFLNLAPVVLMTLALYFLTGRAAVGYGLTAGVVLALSAANWFKLLFRNDPVMFEDLLLIKEAWRMAGSYQLSLTRSMAAAVGVAAAWLLVLRLCARGRLPLRPRYLGLCAVLALSLPVWELVTSEGVYDQGTANPALLNRLSATQVYISKGFVYPFLHSAAQGMDTPPAGYAQGAVQAALEAFPQGDIPQAQKVNLISIMLEAYNDFTQFDIPGLDPSVYADYHALEAEGVSGDLVTNIFAGGTVDTERMFLTGYSHLPSFRGPTNAYPWYFRSQGYYATGAHPCFAWFYNRENVNQNLGLQDYRFVENYFDPLTDGEVGYDNLFFPELIAQWEARPKDRPYFSYNLTYQGHGPYNDDVTWFGDHYVTGGDYTPQERNILNNYFGSIYNTNQNLAAFFDYYRSAQEPVVIVLFGDHNPWLGDGNSVYHALGIDLDVSGEAGFYNYYATRYLIWANDAAKAVLGRDFTGEGPAISPNYLMNQVFRQCGWTGPAYTQATQQVMDAVPVINVPTGLYVEEGTLTDRLTREGEALVAEYEALQYYYRKHFLYTE